MGVVRVLYAVPGVGKSTLAAALAARHEVAHLELDALRATLQGGSPMPPAFASEYTTDAWRRFGDLTEATAVAGYLAVRVAFTDAVAGALLRGQSAGHAESAVIDPTVAVAAGASPKLIVVHDADQHDERFAVHRSRSAATDQQFSAARLIQHHLLSEAHALGIEVIANDESPERLPRGPDG